MDDEADELLEQIAHEVVLAEPAVRLELGEDDDVVLPAARCRCGQRYPWRVTRIA